jgi:hypothetical protein
MFDGKSYLTNCNVVVVSLSLINTITRAAQPAALAYMISTNLALVISSRIIHNKQDCLLISIVPVGHHCIVHVMNPCQLGHIHGHMSITIFQRSCLPQAKLTTSCVPGRLQRLWAAVYCIWKTSELIGVCLVCPVEEIDHSPVARFV